MVLSGVQSYLPNYSMHTLPKVPYGASRLRMMLSSKLSSEKLAKCWRRMPYAEDRSRTSPRVVAPACRGRTYRKDTRERSVLLPEALGGISAAAQLGFSFSCWRTTAVLPVQTAEADAADCFSPAAEAPANDPAGWLRAGNHPSSHQ